MKSLAYRVLALLAAGDFVSGEAMARALGKSRASVWHAVRELQAAGLEIYQVRGRGYRLAQPVSLLEHAAVGRALGAAARHITLELVDSIESTNTELMARAQRGAATGSALAAEWQTAGRGRQGRPWRAGIGGALTFSMLWRFACGANELAGLSLAVGTALARALEANGASGIGLKWPNDLVWAGRKLAGILIELHGDVLGPTAAVIGIGVNVRLSAQLERDIDQPAADLETACGRMVDRNAALAGMLSALAGALELFATAGFAPFRAEWTARHVHQDRAVTIALPDARREHGVARGVAANGALVVESAQGLRHYHAGDVSVRTRGAGRMGA